MNALRYLERNPSEFFSIEEWPSREVLQHTDQRLIESLIALRTAHRQPIYPSKHPQGWARFNGSTTSKHYAVDRPSIAGDVFPAGDVLDCWLQAVKIPAFGGIGLYLDTNLSATQPGAMLHLDLRSGPRVFWVRNEIGDYVYKNLDPDLFWSMLPRVRRRVWSG